MKKRRASLPDSLIAQLWAVSTSSLMTLTTEQLAVVRVRVPQDFVQWGLCHATQARREQTQPLKQTEQARQLPVFQEESRGDG